MKSLIRNIKYQGKNIYRDKGFSFYSLIYPLILASLFYLAFNGIINMDLENVDIGIKDDSPIEHILKEIDIINIHKLLDKEIDEKLEKGEIHGFIDNDLNLLVKESGINQSIIKSILEQIKQSIKLNMPIENLDFTVNYTIDRNQESNSILIAFYSLIAMFSTYGIYSGIETVSLIQANLTNVGARLNSTPVRRYSFLLAGIIVSFIFNLLSNVVLLLFIKFVLKIRLFYELKYNIVFILLGNLFGVCLGVLIGVSNRKSEGVKTAIGIATTIFLSFLSGMMGVGIKVYIDKYAPMVNRLNPISILTNNFYRINLLGNINGVKEGIITLIASCLILISISYVFLRRRNYDSL